MKRNFSREFQDSDTKNIIEKIKIGVVGVGPFVGTTFVATSIAREIANSFDRGVAFVELGTNSCNKPLLYDAMGIDKRFSGRKFHSFHTLVKNNKYIRGYRNIDSKINWAIFTPVSRNVKLTGLQELRLINNIYADIIICDLGSETKDYRLAEMDVLIGVMDPMPSRLIGARRVYQILKSEEKEGKSICWVINKMNRGISNRSFRDYIKIKDFVSIPLIRPELFYIAEYNCRFPYEQKEIKDRISGKINTLLKSNILDFI